MNLDRRSARRAKISLFCNQYIDGTPVLSEALELSMNGMLVRRVLGPNQERALYALELGLPGAAEDRVFVCASPVWKHGPYEALRFIAQSVGDKLRLANVLSQVA